MMCEAVKVGSKGVIGEEHRRLVPMDGVYGVRSRDHMECLFAMHAQGPGYFS